ncbi:hypothetical protein chiPu_0010389 [Chiloscyllium punctatum]|uniref:Uncharacterized protein n=1 Tax=Chiloscyllium punctatum TaxID=137246 RepID=A0A401SNF4_CHIPU|nr:hypothetical protein [Chiloscyllium punctatum]
MTSVSTSKLQHVRIILQKTLRISSTLSELCPSKVLGIFRKAELDDRRGKKACLGDLHIVTLRIWSLILKIVLQ